ncbi:trypsin [Saccharopolyspora erythraea NRRL 2338]|uniref:Secreted trypsin-like serine protease n=2 Tax=Saccharopolyspora erythraea TaxID=1836 RepID=A4FHA9_SACEN|nr:serine protease [Saccharopolyspora erythraea]EQD86842.1 trypsin [Saccharopolyspora erythraea D]PFG97134.1 trypsin [Saccharopolyspora erythraea NRRL 2338]QRK87337.1 serine protease [Saccharopolyspora erythraea]CAM03434.1 secreted trypsin-like serine protease [Saccharopolyspora erythraea NRRL 2338]
MGKRSIVAALLAASAAAALTASSAVAAPGAGGAQPFIVGGQDATETYAFMAGMQTKDGEHNCGAALISPEWLVTAGHCVTDPTTNQPHDPSQWQYRIGTTDRTQGGEVVGVDRFIPHEKWSWTGSGNYDVALVHLAKPVQAAPVEIAAESPKAGTEVREIGWGLTCPERGCGDAPVKLQQLDTTIAEDQACRAVPDSGFDQAGELCMDNKGGTASACFGDSGGPAVVRAGDRWTLVGATSRGQSANCPEHAGIYTDVTAYKDWIAEHTGGQVTSAR